MSKKTDNSKLWEKVALRKQNLPKKARVLDLYCGTGQMYKYAYKDSYRYHGVDNKTIHDPKICTKTNNIIYITRYPLDAFNVFDLDAYGCPWKQFFLILSRLKPKDDVRFFLTDGLVLAKSLNQKPTNMLSALEQIPKGMKIYGMNRFYVDMFATMLLRASRKYNLKINKAQYFHNDARTVYYWYINLSILH